MSDTVKKQHYIWREYLTRWTDSGDRFNGKLFVLRKMLRGKQERIEFCKLQNIGYEKYYYDVPGFQEKDKLFLVQFLAHMQEKEFVKIGIEPKIFSEAAEQRDFIEKRIMCPYENIDNKWSFLDKLSKGDLSFYRDSKWQILLDKLRKCMLDSILLSDNQLSDEEIINLVDESLQGDLEEDDLKYEFHRFFCMQYFRSPRIRNDTVANIEELKKEREELKDLDTNFYVNMVAMYFAERMALNITQNFSTSILLLENKTDIPFVTGDTPIVNMTGTEMDKMSVFHYPISPQIAVWLIVSNKLSEMAKINHNMYMPLNQEFISIVKNCNQKLADNCVNEIYSNDDNCLKKIRCHSK